MKRFPRGEVENGATHNPSQGILKIPNVNEASERNAEMKTPIPKGTGAEPPSNDGSSEALYGEIWSADQSADARSITATWTKEVN